MRLPFTVLLIRKYQTYMDSPDQSNGPFYSADHRLSLLILTMGLKIPIS